MTDILKQKQQELERMLSITQKQLAGTGTIQGRLEIERRGDKVIYYKCTGSEKGDCRTKTYIRQADAAEARQLAQYAYDKRALQIIKEQLAAIDGFLKKWDEDKLKSLYGNMKKERKELIEAVEVDDSSFAAEWQNVKYTPGDFAPNLPEIYTNKGERVRSKSEKIVADELYRFNIPYRYEYPITLDGRTVRPDFCVLNTRSRKVFFMELFGMMDDPDYAQKNVWKINMYARQGYLPGKNLLFLYETSDQPVDMKAFRALAKAYLK